MHSLKGIALLASTLIPGVAAQAAVVAAWNTNVVVGDQQTNSLTATETANGVSVMPLARTGYAVGNAGWDAGEGFVFGGAGTANTGPASDLGKYIEFSVFMLPSIPDGPPPPPPPGGFPVSAIASNTLSLSQLNLYVSVELATDGANGDDTIEVRYGVGSFTTSNSLGTTVITNTGGATGQLISYDLSGIAALQDVSQPVFFRIYQSGGSSSNITAAVGNNPLGNGIEVIGTIPEPRAAGVLVGSVVVVVALLRRRRRD